MTHTLFTSESVAIGHPDKMADQISDAILDGCLAKDPNSRVACEVLVAKGLIVIGGEITTSAVINYQEIARNVVREIGYTNPALGFDFRSCAAQGYSDIHEVYLGHPHTAVDTPFVDIGHRRPQPQKLMICSFASHLPPVSNRLCVDSRSFQPK